MNGPFLKMRQLSDDDGEDGKADAARGPGPAEVEIKAGEKRSRDAAFKKHSCSLDAQSLGEKRGTRDRSCSIPAHVSFVPLSLGSSAPEQLPSSSQSEDEDEDEPAPIPSTTTSTTTSTTPRSPLAGSRTVSRRGLSISLPPASNSPPRMLPTISPRDLSFVMSDLEEEIERIERSEPKQLTPRVSFPSLLFPSFEREQQHQSHVCYKLTRETCVFLSLWCSALLPMP